MTISPKDRLILALDFPTLEEAKHMSDGLEGVVTQYKIGFELILNGGLTLAEEIMARGDDVFLDMKLLDIPNTVKMAAASAARLGVRYLTVHAYPFAIEAAREGVDSVQGARTEILGVTVMTSVTPAQLSNAGYDKSTEEILISRAQSCAQLGADGLILSARDIATIKPFIGDNLKCITPGVRPASADKGDQHRVMTPQKAIQAGSYALVVGRPITQSKNPKHAAETILSEIELA